ncbi:MAG: hypothetical protein EA339_09975 [Rhodobacteraceae bacterium]|nr:MAG: hypothetical protein EA339_09975 [Paracoccaceae bacterium]
MFKAIKNTYHKSLGATVAQNLLEMHAKNLDREIDPHMIANRLVEAAWVEKAQLFDGSFGQRPFKSSIAAAAFGKALRDDGFDFDQRCLYAMCLGSILQEIEINGHLYPLNGIDQEILQKCVTDFHSFSEEFAESPLGKDADYIRSFMDRSEP